MPPKPAEGSGGSGGPLSRPAPARGPGGQSLAARRRPTSTRSAAGEGGGGRPPAQPGILRFYTEDAPGLKIGPTTVLVSSLVFIGCVVLLHIWGKLRGN